MLSIHDLDEEIRQAEQRLEHRREALNWNLYTSRERTTRSLTSPGMLIGALLAGFLVERLGRSQPAHDGDGATNGGAVSVQRTGIAGLAAGLGAAAFRSALRNPQVWNSVRDLWGQPPSAEALRGILGVGPRGVVPAPRAHV